MTALWTSEAAGAATGGTLFGHSWTATGVSIDTRTLQPGDLFVALKDIRDGHDFVSQALDKGAAAALVSRVPDGLGDDARLLIVDDVLAALERLGAAARTRTKAQVIAVTGSAGKTSTKEMLHHVLDTQGKTHAAEASYNNHWGVPLTLARMPADTDFAVIEIGMNHPGEIAPLARLTRPHVAIITTVAAAHLEAFASLEDIAREKAAIFEGLEPGGTAIFNGDLETSSILADLATHPNGFAIGFGTDPHGIMVAEDITLTDTSSVVRGRFHGEPYLFKLAVPGRHFAMNALAVLAAVSIAGGDFGVAALDIATWAPSAGRGQRETLMLDVGEGLTIDLIDDAFNANPASMEAAFEVLAATQPTDNTGRIARGRRIAILGDMLELGPDETALHAALAQLPTMNKIARVDCVGPRMRALYNALPPEKRGTAVDTAEDLASAAHHLLDAGDIVLVKGSKGSKVSLVVDAIKALAAQGRRTPEKGFV
ncbi:MAG: UDP-N-acetylmuramoyl-tripeptide--D-alanyl-D-alanine ligase [Silicimonas sp.]|nr:UDP-N-acetylmuramoyl-tripeptide--D-alanyl-D-alanine ligase [Silicimonas sp.]